MLLDKQGGGSRGGQNQKIQKYKAKQKTETTVLGLVTLAGWFFRFVSFTQVDHMTQFVLAIRA